MNGRAVLYSLVILAGFAVLAVALLLGASVGRWLAVRALGVRGIPFPFGASTKWCWATASVVPPALAFVGSLAGMYAVPALIVAGGLRARGQEGYDESSMRVVVEPEGPAEAAGLRDGDRVDAVNGQRVTTWDALRSTIARHPGEAVDLAVTRESRELHVAVTPDDSGRIRVSVPEVHREVGLGAALGAGAAAPAGFLSATARGVLDTIAGSSRREVSGPVAIVKETRGRSRGPDVVTLFGLLGSYLLPFMSIPALFLAPGRRRKR